MPRRYHGPIPSPLTAVVLVATLALLSPTRVDALSFFDAFSHSRTTTAAKQIAPGVSPAGTGWWCRTEGECLPCPPGARNSDVCKIYGNRRPLICVPRHNANNLASSSSSSASPPSDPDSPPSLELDDFAQAGSGDRTPHAQGEPGAGTVGSNGAAVAVAPKPLVAPAGSRAEADSFAREDEQNFGTGNQGAIGQGGGSSGAGGLPASDGNEDAESEAGLRHSASSKADQELADELQAERRRRRRSSSEQNAQADRIMRDLLERSTGAISTWEACPKVLHSEYHDYFEFILCNAGFAAAAIVVLIFRQRTLALQQFARLAARIMQTQSA